jgi:hypothetical protein
VGIRIMLRQGLIGIILVTTAVFVASCGQRIAVEYPEDYIEDSYEY